MELISPRRGGPAAWIAAGAILVAAASCARSIRPGGGPEDRTPPVVVAVSPESLAVGVPRDADLRIMFSEPIERASLDRGLWISPPLVPDKISVSGEEARISLREPLPESTSVQVALTTVVQDIRRNPLAEPYTWMFSTGDSIARGRVRGTVERVGGGASGQVLVALYPVLADTLPDPRVEAPRAITQAGTEGVFSLGGLDPDGTVYLLYAMVDRDGNREIVGRGEYYTAVPDSVTVVSDRLDVQTTLRLVDPEAPSTLQGTLTRAPDDSVAVWVALYAADDDSLRAARHSAKTDTTGAYRIRGVAPATYRMIGFCDGDENGRRDPADLWLELDPALVVPPGEEMDLGERAGPRCLP